MLTIFNLFLIVLMFFVLSAVIFKEHKTKMYNIMAHIILLGYCSILFIFLNISIN
jgi:hypothetical protein